MVMGWARAWGWPWRRRFGGAAAWDAVESMRPLAWAWRGAHQSPGRGGRGTRLPRLSPLREGPRGSAPDRGALGPDADGGRRLAPPGRSSAVWCRHGRPADRRRGAVPVEREPGPPSLSRNRFDPAQRAPNSPADWYRSCASSQSPRENGIDFGRRAGRQGTDVGRCVARRWPAVAAGVALRTAAWSPPSRIP